MKVWQVYENDGFESEGIGPEFSSKADAFTYARELNHRPGRPAFTFYEVKEEEVPAPPTRWQV
jgi:hypothetical protein